MKHFEHPIYEVAVCGVLLYGIDAVKPHTHFSDEPTCLRCLQWKPAVLDSLVHTHAVDHRALQVGDIYQVNLSPSERIRSMVCTRDVVFIGIERYQSGSIAVFALDGSRWPLDIGAC